MRRLDKLGIPVPVGRSNRKWCKYCERSCGYHTCVPLVAGADIGTTGYCDERSVVVLARLGSSEVVKPFD